MIPTGSAELVPLVSRNLAHQKLHDALHRHVGRGKRHTVKQAAAGSGVHPRMIQAFMAPIDSGEFRRPDLEEVLSLASFLGPDFTTDVLAPTGQGAFWLPETDDTPPGALAADVSEDAATVVRAASEGQFAQAERHGLSVVGRRLMSRGAQLARMAA